MADKKQTQDPLDLEVAMSSSEAFIIKYKNKFLAGIAAIVIVVGGVLGYQHFIAEPNEKKASEALFKGEQYFMADNYEFALNGDSLGYEGFLKVADEFSGTEAGQLANAYAGICYKNLGKNDEAIKYLKKFSADDNLVSPAIYGAIGDCYFESNSIKDAESYYKKAIDSKNNMIAPLYTYRLAMLYFNNGDNAKAAELMEKLKDDYPQSNEASDADKYIEYFQNLKK